MVCHPVAPLGAGGTTSSVCKFPSPSVARTRIRWEPTGASHSSDHCRQLLSDKDSDSSASNHSAPSPSWTSTLEIPILSRIVLVSDAFDAMTSTRAYQPALPISFAVNEIRKHTGTQFDPAVVEIFLELAAVERLPLVLSA